MPLFLKLSFFNSSLHIKNLSVLVIYFDMNFIIIVMIFLPNQQMIFLDLNNLQFTNFLSRDFIQLKSPAEANIHINVLFPKRHLFLSRFYCVNCKESSFSLSFLLLFSSNFKILLSLHFSTIL